jgi:diadenylate cyclase
MDQVRWPGWSGVFEILVLSIALYYIILFFRGTRGAQVLTGLVIFYVATLLLARFFQMEALKWLLQRFSVYLAVALVVIFQPEIRRALAELGKQPSFTLSARERSLVDAVVQAAALLSERKIGALIAIERQIGTRVVQESGKPIDAVVSPELLAGIFFPHTPLHDGGVVIAGDRVAAAGCVFPLAQQDDATYRGLGTRHRAAVGMSEETDAVVVIVSEETGTISLAFNGRLSRGMDSDRLRRALTALVQRSRRAKSRWQRAREEISALRGGGAPASTPAGEGGDGA